MKKPYRQADGFYHVDGKKYKMLFGSREQVVNGTVYKTTGGLTKTDLVMNKWGRIVSAKKFKTAKKEMRLQKHGFFAKKGKFGAVTRKMKRGGVSNSIVNQDEEQDKEQDDVNGDDADINVNVNDNVGIQGSAPIIDPTTSNSKETRIRSDPKETPIKSDLKKTLITPDPTQKVFAPATTTDTAAAVAGPAVTAAVPPAAVVGGKSKKSRKHR